MRRLHRDQRGQSLVIVLSLITILFLLGSALAVHASAALRATRASTGQGNDFYAADAANELGIWWQRNGKAGNPPAQTINGVTTSTTITTAAGGGGTCPGSLKPGNPLMGMETGVMVSAWTGGWATTSNDVTVVSSPVRSGSYALRVHPTTALSDTRAEYDNAPAQRIIARFSIRFDLLPSADAVVWAVTLSTSTGSTYPYLFLFYKASTQKWALAFGRTTLAVQQQASVGPTAGAWQSFDIDTTIQTPTPRFAQWMIDGGVQPSLSQADANVTLSGTQVRFGQYSTVTTADYTAYYDDIAISLYAAEYPIGDLKILPLTPNAMGTHNTPGNFQNNDNTAIAAASWQRVDEIPMTATTDYVKQVTASSTSYLEFGFQDTTETCIRAGALAVAVHGSGTQSNNATVYAVTTMSYTICAAGFNFTTLKYCELSANFASYTDPYNDMWNQSRVNNFVARFGYSTDVSPVPYLDALLLEYGYRPMSGGPATVTIVGTGGGSTTTTSYPDAGAGVPTLSTWTVTK